MLANFPSNLHPMAQFVAAIAALSSESKFAKVCFCSPVCIKIHNY